KASNVCDFPEVDLLIFCYLPCKLGEADRRRQLGFGESLKVLPDLRWRPKMNQQSLLSVSTTDPLCCHQASRLSLACPPPFNWPAHHASSQMNLRLSWRYFPR